MKKSLLLLALSTSGGKRAVPSTGLGTAESDPHVARCAGCDGFGTQTRHGRSASSAKSSAPPTAAASLDVAPRRQRTPTPWNVLFVDQNSGWAAGRKRVDLSLDRRRSHLDGTVLQPEYHPLKRSPS